MNTPAGRPANPLARLLDTYAPPNGRALWFLVLVIAFLAALDAGGGRLLNLGTVFSVTQLFATYGLVALGFGMVMMLREFDVSLAGSFSLGGVVAVLVGGSNPVLGALAGMAVGVAAGLIQGGLLVWLRIPAISVTLGGLLIMSGLAFVLSGGTTISYPNREVTRWLQESELGGMISHRGLIVLAFYVLAAWVYTHTRIGRDLIAAGSNRAGSSNAGVNTSVLLVAALTAAGGLSALGGVLLCYGLAAAAGQALADVLAPATAAAIIGGISLGGGKGRPMGILIGVLIICLLRSGLTALGTGPKALDAITGAVLLFVAVLDGSQLQDRLIGWKRALGARFNRS